ncbi:GNAT family N-acetyltransferase [Streptomyces sp. NPDC059402]|uniref:GNAT family N-acetyltransferase n=1 Tax=Streptomyces sp. NPDC059402 TaxID=3346822 RepID=UPI0036CF63B4
MERPGARRRAGAWSPARGRGRTSHSPASRGRRTESLLVSRYSSADDGWNAAFFADRPQPVLPGAGNLLLRPWEPADAPAFLSAYRDREVRRWHRRRPAGGAQVREWFDTYRQDWEREKGGHWAVAHDDGRHDMHLHATVRGD